MHALALALALASQAAPAPPPAQAPACPDEVDARFERTHALLAAFADDARASRVTGAVSSGVVGAGLIGAGIAYVAVSYADHQLAVKDAEDTRIAGAILAGSAAIPAALMVAQLVSTSPEEERLAAFEASAGEKQARIDAARASIAQQASTPSWGAVLGGAAFIVGGVASAAAGGVFLALPHIPDVERGPMAHATGAELIGAGVSSVGIGAALLLAGGSNATLQATLLE